MINITKFIKNALALINSFMMPGYQVSITSPDIDETAFNRVKKVINDNGFIFVIDRDNIQRGAIISEYTRQRKYAIGIALTRPKLEYPQRQLGLHISIENDYKGSKPELRAEIDKLGDALYAELSRYIAKNRLFKYSGRTPGAG